MKLFKKAKLSLALTAAIGAVALSGQATAVNLATNGIGEVAIAPYYTVNDGWMTLINLTNITNKPIVVKVRVHEGKNSRDVFDFDVALSGRDVFSAVIKKDANDNPMMESTDTDTCLIGAARKGEVSSLAKTLSPLGYSGDDDRGNSNDDALYTAGTVTDKIRLGEGYIEFIVMGYTEVAPIDGLNGVIGVTAANAPGFTNDTNVNTNTVGYNIEQHNCAAVAAAFTDDNMVGGPNMTQPATTQSQFGEPINALKFNFRLLNPSRGIEVGNTATTWANFFGTAGADGTITPQTNEGCTVGRGQERDATSVGEGGTVSGTEWDPAGAVGSCANLMTAQRPYAFLEPSLNDAYPATALMISDSLNASSTVDPDTVDPERTQPAAVASPGSRGVDALSLTIMRSSVINEWSLNSQLGSKTDWVVTFPTKSFFVDSGEGRQAARIPGDRDEAFYDSVNDPDAYFNAASSARVDNGGTIDSVTYPPFSSRFGADGSCNDVSFAAFDRAEHAEASADGVIPSPAPASARTQLCFEANVLTFNGVGSVLGSNNIRNVPLPILTGNGAEAGWMRLDLTADSAAQAPAGNDPDGVNNVDNGLAGYSGLPVIGFMIKQRTFTDDVTKNYASSVDHSFERDRKYQ